MKKKKLKILKLTKKDLLAIRGGRTTSGTTQQRAMAEGWFFNYAMAYAKDGTITLTPKTKPKVVVPAKALPRK